MLEAASFAAFRTVCPVRPCAVEIDPRGADKLRARVFGARNGSLIHRKTPFGFWFFVWLRLMKSDSIIQDCHCFVNPFLGGICGFFGGRGAPASGGGFPSLSPAAPAFSLAFCPLSPQPPSQWEGGDFLLSYARGFAPCIPGLNPRGTGSTCRCRRLNGGVPPALLGSASVRVPGGGFPSLSPAAPAFSLAFLPLSPPPFPAGRGRPYFYARGFAPCIPGNLRFAAKPTEFLYLERCRKPRRGGDRGEELRRLRWSSPGAD